MSAPPQRPTFRLGTAEDLPFVQSLSGRAFDWLGDYPTILRGWFETSGVQTLLAEVDGRPVGFVMWSFVRTAEGAAPVADVVALAVAAEHQRAGIGARLLARAVASAAACGHLVGATRACLSVAEQNAPARALFRRAGFLRAPREDTHYATGQRCLRMSRPLPVPRPEEPEEPYEVHDHAAPR